MLDPSGMESVFRHLGLDQTFINSHRNAGRPDAETAELRVLNRWTDIKPEAKLTDLLKALRAANRDAAQKLHKKWRIPYPAEESQGSFS